MCVVGRAGFGKKSYERKASRRRRPTSTMARLFAERGSPTSTARTERTARAVPPGRASRPSSCAAANEDDDDGEEEASLLGSAAKLQQQPPLRWQTVLVLCIVALGLVMRWPGHGSSSGTEGDGADCVDRWAVLYPSEVDEWRRHSCSWKRKWGQCAEFNEQCARTCGQCVPPSGSHAPYAAAAEDDPESATAAHVTAPSVASGGSPDAGRATRSQMEVLEHVLRARRQQGAAVTARRQRVHGAPAAAAAAGDAAGDAYAYAAGEASSSELARKVTTTTASFDDTYEGPSSSSSPTSGATATDKGTDTPGRQHYVRGDGFSVISEAAECGVPIRQPAVAAESFAMAAVEAKPVTASGRRYASVTYLSSVVMLHPGEVAHVAKDVTLTRPEGAVAITQYMVELLLQTGKELFPAPSAGAYLKRLTLQPRPSVGSSRCTPQPAMLVGEEGRRVRVVLPHPFGILTPNATDDWAADLHIMRTDGLVLDAQLAKQCACMRNDIGSVHCCPHSCRFAVRNREAPAQQFRLSLVLTWLLAAEAKDGQEPSADPSLAVRPVVSLWLPVSPGAAAMRKAMPVACRRRDPEAETEFDLAASCDAPKHSRSRGEACTTTLRGSSFQLHRQLRLVSALPLLGPRIQHLSLQASASTRRPPEDVSSEARPLCTCEPTEYGQKSSCGICSPSNTGAARLHAQAVFNTTEHVLGADAGWHAYVAARSVGDRDA